MNRTRSSIRPGFEGRQEIRIPARIEVHLRKADDSGSGEVLSTENISVHGARLLAYGPWKLGEAVELRAMRRNLVAEGKIAYCRRLESGKYAVGVKIMKLVSNWDLFPPQRQ